jgi:hypothetical protein
MGIKKLTKRNAIVGLVALTLLCFIVGFLILHYLFPQNYFKLYPLIPIYFFLLTLLEIEILSKYKEKEFVTMTNKFMQFCDLKRLWHPSGQKWSLRRDRLSRPQEHILLVQK